MGVVHEAVEDAVGQSGIADLLVPPRDRQLRGQDRRAHLDCWGQSGLGRTARVISLDQGNDEY